MSNIEDFSEGLRTVFHYPKENESRYERATSAAMDTHGNSWGCISFENKGTRVIALQAMDSHGNCTYERKIRDCNTPSTPVLFARTDGGISAVWIEWKEDRWSVIYAEKQYTEPDFSLATVHTSQSACLQPAMCIHNGSPFIVWSGYDKTYKRFVIFSSQYGNSEWGAPIAHISGEGQCFRPAVCSDQMRMFIAWDEGIDGCQQIAVKEINPCNWTERDYIIQREGERLIRPALIIDGSAACSLACISIKDILIR